MNSGSMNRRTRRSLVASLCMAFLLGACGGGGSSESEGSPAAADPTTSQPDSGSEAETETDEPSQAETVPLTIAATSNLVGLPVFAGVEQGIFEEHNLDVDLQLVSSGSDAARALQSGDAQFSASSTVSVIAIRSGGVDVQMVGMTSADATDASYDLGNGVLARLDSGISADDPSTLVGKKIATNVGGSPHAYLLGYLADNGIEEGEVEIVNTPVPETVTALTQGLVDAIATVEPYLSDAALQLGDNGARLSQLEGYTTAQVGLVALSSYIEENPDIVNRFAAALADAAQFVRENPDESLQAAMNYIEGLDMDVAREAHKIATTDPRTSVCIAAAIDVASQAALEADQITEEISGDDVVYYDAMAAAMDSHPELFEDLAPLPDSASGC